MKTLCLLLVVFLAAELGARAETLAQMAAEPAGISVERMKSIPLVVSAGEKNWMQVPDKLTTHLASIFKPDKDKEGIADILVQKDGFLLLACNYDYQGNRLGNWKAHVSDAVAMKRKGWKLLSESELGGKLIQGDKRQQVIFYKRVSRGEHLYLRCNKYDPPYPIVLKR
jgi:hypothetical protein